MGVWGVRGPIGAVPIQAPNDMANPIERESQKPTKNPTNLSQWKQLMRHNNNNKYMCCQSRTESIERTMVLSDTIQG